MGVRDSFLVAMGKIVKTHGNKGEVQVYPYARDADNLLKYKAFFIGRQGKAEGFLKIDSARIQGPNRLVLSVDGVKDMSQAEALVGFELFLEQADMPGLSDGEYYWHELIGLKAVTVEGDELGVLSDILETGANDVYVIKGPRGDILIPAIEQVIKEINPRAGIIRIDLLPGLLEANAL